MKIAIAVVAALCAALCFALGALIEQGAARQTHARALRFGLLVALAHERRWLAGIAITVVSFGIQGVALGFGPRSRWPGSRFSATHRSCWQRSAGSPGRPARKAAGSAHRGTLKCRELADGGLVRPGEPGGWARTGATARLLFSFTGQVTGFGWHWRQCRATVPLAEYRQHAHPQYLRQARRL